MKRVLLLLMLWLGVSVSIFGQGKLEKSEKSLTKSLEQKSDAMHSNAVTSRNSSSSTDNSLTEVFGAFLVKSLMVVTYGVLVETPMEREHRASAALSLQNIHITILVKATMPMNKEMIANCFVSKFLISLS